VGSLTSIILILGVGVKMIFHSKRVDDKRFCAFLVFVAPINHWRF
jgi:hypothetical protein